MDLFQRKFSAQEVAHATGATSKQISDWCDMGLIIGQREKLGKGNRRAFSLFNLSEVAVARALMDVGVRAPSDAFRAAQRFSHSSSGGFNWPGDDGLSDYDAPRYPGLPWHHGEGETFAFVAGQNCSIQLEATLERAIRELRNPIGFIALNISAVFARTMQALGLDYRVVLDSIYGAEKA